jgi:serine/threonine protein kinase
VAIHPLQESHIIHHPYIMEEKSGDPYLGRVIRGYCLEELLEERNLIAVYRAHTEELWQVPELTISIIPIPEELSKQAHTRFKARFIHDARKLIKLRHQHLFPLYGYGEQDGFFYLLTPPIQGESLTNRLHHKKPWSATEALTILLPLAAALDYLHSQGFVYQFFGPTSVLLQSDQTVLLHDFGLAQLLSMRGLEQEMPDSKTYMHLQTIAGVSLGTPEYLAPEVIKGAAVDKRSDIYALGTLLFALLSGTTPFTGKSYLDIAQMHIKAPLPSLHTIAPEIPIALELVVNRALQRNPDHRFQTVGEFITTCTHVINERINAPKSVSLVQTIEQLKMLEAPRMSRSEESQENFLLMGGDTLFPKAGKDLSTANIDAPISTISSSVLSQGTKNNETLEAGITQHTPTTQMGTMVNQLQRLKERLQAQSAHIQPEDIP